MQPAGQSPTLAHPAAPLAACVQRHPCTTTKIGCHGNVPRWIENLFNTSSRVGSTNPETLTKLGTVDFEMIGLTEVVTINK